MGTKINNISKPKIKPTRSLKKSSRQRNYNLGFEIVHVYPETTTGSMKIYK
jgi:hypothetical protein